ncbi:hypothetical protein [Streptomyces coriariae]|nr:hypothetical protein [Streptomyces coriariae]
MDGQPVLVDEAVPHESRAAPHDDHLRAAAVDSTAGTGVEAI